MKKSVMYFVYVIKSEKDGRLYVGLSANPQIRLREHNRGHVFSTKGYRKWKLAYIEKTLDRPSARQREKYLKSGVGKEFLKSIVNKQ